MKKILILLFLILGLSFGCVFPRAPVPTQAPPKSTEYKSNGEMIYHTGYNMKGERIKFTYGPHWLEVHGGSCASCHGEEGKGGVIPHMCTEVAPEITYHALTEEEHEEHGEEEEHPPYTDELIKRAITQGINPAGESFDYCMPQFKMSEEDLKDLIGYLKTLE